MFRLVCIKCSATTKPYQQVLDCIFDIFLEAIHLINSSMFLFTVLFFRNSVNYPPLMRGVPRLGMGASAPWSFSFPAYEESSLQDDCNHPNLTISTGDPRRPVRFIHNEGLSFLCVRMSGCACHPFRLIQDILCCLLIPVHGMSAYRAEIRPVRQF